MNPWYFIHRIGSKGFTREEGGVEQQIQELEASVHFRTGVFPFSNATQRNAAPVWKSRGRATLRSLAQHDRARQAGVSWLEVSPPLFDPTNTISTTLRCTLDSGNNPSTYMNANM